jgi:hypothetical protein
MNIKSVINSLVLLLPLSMVGQVNAKYSGLDLTNHTATVSVSQSTLCLPIKNKSPECYSVLVGKGTPLGTYELSIFRTNKKGYGGEVLGYHQSGKDLYAIHRVWLGNPSENRLSRIKSNDPSDRLITNGCINVTDDVYDKVRNMLVVKIVA